MLESFTEIDALGFESQLTAVMVAANLGHVEVLRELIQQGANAQIISGPRNRSALHWAAFEPDNTAVMELLLNENLDINLEDLFGSTPVAIAAWAGNIGNVEFLLNQVQHSSQPAAA